MNNKYIRKYIFNLKTKILLKRFNHYFSMGLLVNKKNQENGFRCFKRLVFGGNLKCQN